MISTRQTVSHAPGTGPYRLGMPRAPKDFTVSDVSMGWRDSNPALVGRGVAAPRAFDVTITIDDLPLTVVLSVEIGIGGEPLAKRLEVVAGKDSTITTSGLRKLLVDQLLKVAVAKASFPTTNQPGVVVGEGSGYTAYQIEGPGPFGEPGPVTYVQPLPLSAVDTRQQRQDERARQAAKIYAAAVNSGSRAPGDAVATEMGYSRSQAARYIRRARELGMLPAADAKDGEQ